MWVMNLYIFNPSCNIVVLILFILNHTFSLFYIIWVFHKLWHVSSLFFHSDIIYTVLNIYTLKENNSLIFLQISNTVTHTNYVPRISTIHHIRSYIRIYKIFKEHRNVWKTTVFDTPLEWYTIDLHFLTIFNSESIYKATKSSFIYIINKILGLNELKAKIVRDTELKNSTLSRVQAASEI